MVSKSPITHVIAVDQIWKEGDLRFERYVKIVKIGSIEGLVPTMVIALRRLIIEDGIKDGLTLYRVSARAMRWFAGSKFWGSIEVPVENALRD